MAPSDPSRPWSRSPFADAALLAEQVNPDQVAPGSTNKPPHIWFATLLADGELSDALGFVAHALPRYEAVAWGAQALLEMGAVERLDPIMVAVLRWIDQPSDGLRRAASELAESTRKDSPAKQLGLAVMMSGGSLSGPEFPPVLPPPDVCSKLVYGALMAGAHQLPNPQPALLQALAAGEAMARGE